jgi:hypothetical protein
MQLSDLDHLINWSHEREWRVTNKVRFDYEEIEVIVPSNKYYRKLVEYCDDNDTLDILKEINGIVVMNSMNY